MSSDRRSRRSLLPAIAAALLVASCQSSSSPPASAELSSSSSPAAAAPTRRPLGGGGGVVTEDDVASGQVPCPSGRVSVEIDDVDIEPGYRDGTFDVDVRGTVTNGTDARVRLAVLDPVTVEVDGDDLQTRMLLTEIRPRGWETFTASGTWTSRYSNGRPDVRARLVGWTWADRAYAHCPDGPAI